LAPQCAAVVSHAGHGTVVRPLMHGKPLLSLPMGRDQRDNAARIAARGAGLTLEAEAPPEAIRAALRRLLHEPQFTEAAQRLGAAIQCEADQGALAARLILEACGAT
jgi:UDP:flavonoid glycosyltransferase YjiC (YdhE family)